MGRAILFFHRTSVCWSILCPTFFQNDTNAKEIDANAVATFRVKFDHVAMDNFHAVFTRTPEPDGSRVERRLSRNSSASSRRRQSCQSRRVCGSAGWGGTPLQCVHSSAPGPKNTSGVRPQPPRPGPDAGLNRAVRQRADRRCAAGIFWRGIFSPVDLLLRQPPPSSSPFLLSCSRRFPQWKRPSESTLRECHLSADMKPWRSGEVSGISGGISAPGEFRHLRARIFSAHSCLESSPSGFCGWAAGCGRLLTKGNRGSRRTSSAQPETTFQKL